MRTVLAATALTLIAQAGLGQVSGQTLAQTAPTPPATAVKPKPIAAVPIRSAAPTPADLAATAERTAIQSDLAWTSYYTGAVTGEATDRMTMAIRAFQKDNAGKQTGTLTPQERVLLADAAKKQQQNVGWTIVTDPATGARLGLPSQLVPQRTSDAGGTRWASATGTIQIAVTRRKEPGLTVAAAAERERKEPAGRRIESNLVKPDVYALSGTQGLKKFVVRGQLKDGEIRTLTVLYDQATEGTMEPAAIAMAAAFNAFPSGAQAAVPAPRRRVEYSTGIVASADGAVVVDRLATDGCLSLVVSGIGNADRIAEDKARDIALLRVYGARDLKPLGLGGAVAKPALDVVGIADPQSQGGSSAVSAVRASLGANGDVTPAPAIGFSGAPARDMDGTFAGIVLLKQLVVAGPAPATTQAALVPADAVRGFVKANKVAFSETGGGDAKTSVVRVICVRK